jgi:hypothetical protein
MTSLRSRFLSFSNLAIIVIILLISLSGCLKSVIVVAEQDMTYRLDSILLERQNLYSQVGTYSFSLNITAQNMQYTLYDQNKEIVIKQVYVLSIDQSKKIYELYNALAQANPRYEYLSLLEVQGVGYGVLTLSGTYERQILIDPYQMNLLPDDLKNLIQYMEELYVLNSLNTVSLKD